MKLRKFFVSSTIVILISFPTYSHAFDFSTLLNWYKGQFTTSDSGQNTPDPKDEQHNG